MSLRRKATGAHRDISGAAHPCSEGAESAKSDIRTSFTFQRKRIVQGLDIYCFTLVGSGSTGRQEMSSQAVLVCCWTCVVHGWLTGRVLNFTKSTSTWKCAINSIKAWTFEIDYWNVRC